MVKQNKSQGAYARGKIYRSRRNDAIYWKKYKYERLKKYRKLKLQTGTKMKTIVIKNFDTAIDAIIEKFVNPNFDAFILAPEANIQIKLEGEQWDGELDYKVAEFVVKLQKSLIALYNEQTGGGIKYNTRLMDAEGLRVTVSVEKGCTLFNIDLAGWWKNMESKHQLAAIVVTAGLFAGAYAGVSIYGHMIQKDVATIEADRRLEQARIEAKLELEKKIQERIQEETRQKVVLTTVERALDTAAETNRHMTFLASKMQPKDKMHIGGVTLPARAAKRVFKHAILPDDSLNEFRCFLDGEYVVTAINREKDEATIRFDDKKRAFSLIWLNPSELEIFYKRCAQRRTDEVLPPMPLQLTAYFRGGVFTRGFIQGIGSQREGSMTFPEASLGSASREEDESQSQNDVD